MGSLADYLPGESPVGSAGGSLAKYLPEETSGTESFLRGVAQEGSFGFADELAGALESAFTHKTYRQARDESRAKYAQAESDNPNAYLAGQVGGGLASLAVPGGALGKGLGTAVRGVGGAAALGGIYGAGHSDADLTEGDVGGLARDTAIGAGAGALAHGAVSLAGKAAAKVAPAARGALEKYARSETEDLFGGAAKTAAGKAILGAGAGALSGDENRAGDALKGAALAVAVPAAHRAASKVLKRAILAALEKGGAKAAAEVARAASAVDEPAAEAGAAEVGRLTASPRRPALAEYIPPEEARALGGAPERLALPPMPEREGGRVIKMGPGPAGDAAGPAIPLQGAGDIDSMNPSVRDAVEAFKESMARAKRHMDRGDKFRAGTEAKEAERVLKRALGKAGSR